MNINESIKIEKPKKYIMNQSMDGWINTQNYLNQFECSIKNPIIKGGYIIESLDKNKCFGSTKSSFDLKNIAS